MSRNATFDDDRAGGTRTDKSAGDAGTVRRERRRDLLDRGLVYFIGAVIAIALIAAVGGIVFELMR